MWPLVGAAGVSGLASFFGQERANAANVRSAREQMRFQEGMVGRQEAFQERMANTAVQRQMADLRAAGVNPMLAVMRGTPGAPAPQGASAVGARAEQRDVVGPAVDRSIQALSSALAIRRQKSEIKLIEAQAEATRTGGMLQQRTRLDIEGEGTERSPVSPAEMLRRSIASSGQQKVELERQLLELEKPGAENRAAFERSLMKSLGVDAPTATRLARFFLEVLRMGIRR